MSANKARHVINEDAIDFLTHGCVIASATGFDMCQGRIRLGRSQGSGERRVGIAVDEH